MFEGIILIVEDRESISSTIKDMLSIHGMKVAYIAPSMKEAMDMFKRIGPDLVIMDILLPDGNGLEAAREMLDIKPSTKIVAISAMADEDVRSKALEAGCVEFLQKPFKMKEILGILTSLSS